MFGRTVIVPREQLHRCSRGPNAKTCCSSDTKPPWHRGSVFKGPLSSRSTHQLWALCATMFPRALEEKEHEDRHLGNTGCPIQGLRPCFMLESELEEMPSKVSVEEGKSQKS